MNTFKILKVAFRGQKMGLTQILEWFQNLKNSMTSAEDAKCFGHPSTRKTNEMWYVYLQFY
jgi:hypothetical protein